jgi:hypothetical protein
VAEFPELVKRIFPLDSQAVNAEGIYAVRLCSGGLWRTVVVDDHFPCKTDGTLAYARCNGFELWVMLIEKAFAKLCGSYARIEGGDAGEALSCLTGDPSVFIDFNSESCKNSIASGTLWTQLCKSDDNGDTLIHRTHTTPLKQFCRYLYLSF